MQRIHSPIDSFPRRRGLAPLELVLSLPIMLFLMGLMIIFGTAASWKVRTLANSRQAVWRTFWPRTGSVDPFPQGWPESAEMRDEDATPSIFAEDPFAEFDVVRGPILIDPDTGSWLPVRKDTLDMTVGMRNGFARIERDFPLLAKMPPGKVDFARDHHVLDVTQWSYRSMNIARNLSRRVPFIYEVQLQVRIPQETERYTEAATEIVNNFNKPDLRTLDRDEELRSHFGHYFDFHPRANPEQYCEMDVEIMREEIQQPLIEAIQGTERPPPRRSLGEAGVPGRMTRVFLAMYQQQLAGVNSRIQAIQQMLSQGNLPPGQSGALQAELGQLESRKTGLEGNIGELNRFAEILVP